MFNIGKGKQHRALIIDDEIIFHDMIGEHFKLLSIEHESVCDFDDAVKEINKASEAGKPFSIITIDNELKMGSSTYRLGKNILQRLKLGREFANLNLGCIMITATRFSEREVLNLRDKFGLDYFIPKDELDIESLKEGIKVASIPKRPNFDADALVEMPSIDRRLSMLNETLNTYKNICLIQDRNLAILKQRKAKFGDDSGLKIENEMQECEVSLREAEEKTHQIENQISELMAVNS